MAIYGPSGEKITALPEQKIAQKIRENGFKPDKNCSFCWGRGFLRRKDQKGVFKIEYCGCLRKILPKI